MREALITEFGASPAREDNAAFIQQAIEYEARRQIAILGGGCPRSAAPGAEARIAAAPGGGW